MIVGLRQQKKFSAEKHYDRKEVTAMTYAKPEINTIAEATSAIRIDNSLTKSVSGADLSNPQHQTAPAYFDDEE